MNVFFERIEGYPKPSTNTFRIYIFFPISRSSQQNSKKNIATGLRSPVESGMIILVHAEVCCP
jgi:hypothetical protein